VPEVLGVSKVQSKKHKVATQLEAGLPKMSLDRNRMKEVLLNLVTNAIKYSPKGGTVTVSMKLAAGNLHIDVADEGIGISEKDQESLFQQFFRAETAHDAQVGGTGLGLAIVKGIAEAHGGTVRVKSAIGKGSTFSVILPVRREATRGEVASPF
jgi:signal transduction histidine kinase